jgi:hypothetical protein
MRRTRARRRECKTNRELNRTFPKTEIAEKLLVPPDAENPYDAVSFQQKRLMFDEGKQR